MLCVVLCGGKGTRLHPVTDDLVPKCMAHVAGRPFIDWKLDNLAALGHTDIVLLTAHHGDQIAAHVDVDCWHDPGLGRGLALWSVLDHLPERFWLTYGDTLLDYPRVDVEAVENDAVLTTLDGVDYGAMIVPRDAWNLWRPFHRTLEWLRRAGRLAEFPVTEPWHEINTPDALRETEAWLLSRSEPPTTKPTSSKQPAGTCSPRVSNAS